jgi:hypothetical protein
MPVTSAAELEPTSVPAAEVAAIPASGLEVTSPVHEPGYQVAQDPALVTETDDMSQFVTKFGVEGAEPVHVGMASDLSDEQLAAITTPLPPAGEVVTPTVEPQAMEPESSASPIMEQIGSLEAIAPMQSVEPIVAYVPEVEDSQSFPAVREHEAAPEPGIEAPVMRGATVEPVAELVPEMIVAPEAEPATVPVAQAEVAPIESTPEPAIAEVAAAPEAASAEVISAAAPVIAAFAAPAAVAPAEVAPSPEHVAVAQAVETALAAAAGTAVAGLSLVVHEPATEPRYEESGNEEAGYQVEPAEADLNPEPIGDAALAEELAAALSHKAAEEHPQAAAVSAPIRAQAPETAGLYDTKLADAVARAFESLKPQLITEIMKELGR